MSVDFGYYSTTRPDSLAASLTAVDTEVQLISGTTFPDPATNGGKNYTVILAYGTDREEVCTVTAKPTANTLTVLRGQDGTPATSKNAGDVVVHGVSAREFNAIATKLSKSGGTMTGPLVMASDATVALGATTKQQMEAADQAVRDYALVVAGAALPIGAVIMWGGSTVPVGWHRCDGTAHGSSALAAVIGSANTPDLRDKFVVAAGGAYAAGATGGTAAVTLTAAESGLRDHGHGASAGNESADHVHSGTTSGHNVDHAHYTGSGGGHGHNSSYGNNYQLSPQIQNIDLAGPDVAGPIANTPERLESVFTAGEHSHGWSSGVNTDHSHTFTTVGISANHTHGITVNTSGALNASAAHENRPPYYALTFLIKKA